MPVCKLPPPLQLSLAPLTRKQVLCSSALAQGEAALAN